MPDAPPNTSDSFEIIRTTRSMRRLKPDPVPNELIRKILEAGTCAPSGGNMQRWRFLIIRDAGVKRTVGAYYKRAWDEQVEPRYRSGEPALGMSWERFLRSLDAAEYPAAHIHEAPAWIVPCLERGRADPHLRVVDLSRGSEHAARGPSARPRCDVDDAFICSSRRKPRSHSACRLACIPMPCCRSGIPWDDLGRFAASPSLMSVSENRWGQTCSFL